MPRYDKFNVCGRCASTDYRIAKIQIASDGTIYVFFPGFVDTRGIVCAVRYPRGTGNTATLDTTKHGHVTSHLVKYTHHPDGEAHFSQDSKVYTTIRRQSLPLNQYSGLLFTILLQDITSFPAYTPSKVPHLTCELPDNMQTLKLTGWWFHDSGCQADPASLPIKKLDGIITADGKKRRGLFVKPPAGHVYDQYILFLGFECLPWFWNEKRPALLFYGAFDSPARQLDMKSDTEFLLFTYPCDNYEALLDRIGSIDYSRQLNVAKKLEATGDSRAGVFR